MNQHANPKGWTYKPSNKANPYQVYISIRGKSKYIGAFPTPEKAHEAYLKARADFPYTDPNQRQYQRHETERCKLCGSKIAKRKMKMHQASCIKIEARRYEPFDAKNRTHTIDGETKTMYEWMQVTGLNYYTVLNRWKRGTEDSRLFRPAGRNVFSK